MCRSTRWFRLIYSAILTLTLATISQGQSSDLKQIATLIDKYYANFENFELKATIERTYFGSSIFDREVEHEEKLHIKRDGQTWWGRSTGIDRFPLKGNIHEVEFDREQLRRDGTTIEFDVNDGELYVSAWLDGNSKHPNIFYGNDSAVVYGMNDNDPDLRQRLADLFTDGDLNRQQIDDNVLVLEAEDKFGVHQLSVDRSKNYSPIGYSQQRLSHHWGQPNKPISDFPPHEDTSGYYPRGKMTGINRDVRFTDFRQEAAIWIPNTIEFKREFVFDNGQSVGSTGRITIKKLDLSPSFSSNDFDLRSIPEGTSVEVEDNPSIRFVWKDGKVVKLVDPAVIENLKSVELYAQKPRRIPWMILGFLGGVVLAILVFWRLRNG